MRLYVRMLTLSATKINVIGTKIMSIDKDYLIDELGCKVSGFGFRV
jgi:hypothetical protein